MHPPCCETRHNQDMKGAAWPLAKCPGQEMLMHTTPHLLQFMCVHHLLVYAAWRRGEHKDWAQNTCHLQPLDVSPNRRLPATPATTQAPPPMLCCVNPGQGRRHLAQQKALLGLTLTTQHTTSVPCTHTSGRNGQARARGQAATPLRMDDATTKHLQLCPQAACVRAETYPCHWLMLPS